MTISRSILNVPKDVNVYPVTTKKASLSSNSISTQFYDALRNIFSEQNDVSDKTELQIKLSKEQLMIFSKVLQIQMNARLYNTILNNALETNSLAVKITQKYGDMFNSPADNVTKNVQASSENFSLKADKDLEKIIIQAADRHGVDPNLIRSVIKAESNFDPLATSPRGAMGLMQLMPETAADLGVKDAFNPLENVMGGAKYLKMLLDRYDGQVDLALAAYNWGMGNLERKPDKLPGETLCYIEKVNGHLKSMKN